MKHGWLLLPAFALCLLACATVSDRPEGDDPELELMTFNLRFADTRPPNEWSARRPVALELLKREAPDVIGTQEGVYSQLVDLDDGLPDYDWIGLGRDGGSHGEFMAVFYRRDRLVPLEYDHFWLSDTPWTMASRSWGNNFNRMVTWVRFRDRRNGCQFYAVNTHFDHEVQAAREKSAGLLFERVAQFDPALPILLLGDFNAAAGDNPVHDRLTTADAFVDTWDAVHDEEPAVGTFHDFKGVEGAKGAARIDWVLGRGEIDVRSARILTFERDGQYPSDHFPVTARVTLKSCH
jgi:endonuclease/exonuclease/phosphatase family metal-dependent hydrolase